MIAPPPLLTVAELAALPENGDVRYELQEGALVLAPSPMPEHQRSVRRLLRSIEDQLSDTHAVFADIDIDLQLVDAPAVTGAFTTEEPFPIRLELDELLLPPGQR